MIREDAREIETVPEARRTRALAAGLFLAPFAWASQLLINYSLTPTACAESREWLLHLVSLGMLLVALIGALIARGAWTRLTSGSTVHGDAREAGRRFLALAGLGLSLFVALVIVALDIPTWWLSACQR
jgi:hypothetical protein